MLEKVVVSYCKVLWICWIHSPIHSTSGTLVEHCCTRGLSFFSYPMLSVWWPPKSLLPSFGTTLGLGSVCGLHLSPTTVLNVISFIGSTFLYMSQCNQEICCFYCPKVKSRFCNWFLFSSCGTHFFSASLTFQFSPNVLKLFPCLHLALLQVLKQPY